MPAPTDPPADDVPARFVVDFTGLTLLGIYRVMAKMDEGGMGTVYLGEDTTLGRKVVVKVPHVRFLGESGFRARFRREISELVRLEHPHVVRILARGEHDEIPYFVLQYLGGGSLEARFDAAPVPPASVVPWLATIARTLDFVHERGVVHRDVKPANILFDEQDHVFLSDFGVVKALSDADERLTATGSGIGSPRYMAPEQGRGEAIDGRADQYALACLAYEALSGRVPFEGSVGEILIAKSRNRPPPLADLVPELPATAAAAVMRALSRDPDERFATCAAFAEAFAEPFAEEMAPRRRSLWALALALPLIVALGVVVVHELSGPDEPVRTGVPAPREARPDMRVASQGELPRQRLRYEIEVGTSREVAVRVELTGRTGKTIVAVRGPFRVEEAVGQGRFAVTWQIEHGEVVEAAVKPPLEAQLRSLRDTPLRGVMDDRGYVRLEQDERVTGANMGQGLVTNLHLALGQLTTPLPEQAVGAGAEWTVHRVERHFDTDFTQAKRYELVSIDNHQAHVRFSSALVAPPKQKIELPGGRGIIEKYEVHGEGERQVDLRRFPPRTSRMEMDVVVGFVVESESGTARGESKVNTVIRIDSP